MFASFIDMKIMSTWEEPEPRLAVFDQRVESMKSRLGVVRSPSYEKCNTLKNASKCHRSASFGTLLGYLDSINDCSMVLTVYINQVDKRESHYSQCEPYYL